jgi:hypothetical protein
MSNASTHTGAPRTKRAAESEFHEVIVEKIHESWGIGDPVAEKIDQGYVVKEDGLRRVRLQIDRKTFEAREKAHQDEANNRLAGMAAPEIADSRIGSVSIGLRKGEARELSELTAGMPDKNDLDE